MGNPLDSSSRKTGFDYAMVGDQYTRVGRERVIAPTPKTGLGGVRPEDTDAKKYTDGVLRAASRLEFCGQKVFLI